MLNFTLGTLAGLAFATVALAVGLRQPEVLDRLDLAQKAPAVTLARRTEPVCPPAAPQAGRQEADMLFVPRRLWFVSP